MSVPCFALFQFTGVLGRMIPLPSPNTERRIRFIRLLATRFLFGIRLQAAGRVKCITHKVNILNEAR